MRTLVIAPLAAVMLSGGVGAALAQENTPTAAATIAEPSTAVADRPAAEQARSRTSAVYRETLGAALVSAVDGNYTEAGRIAEAGSIQAELRPSEVVHLLSYATVFYIAGNRLADAQRLATACARLPTASTALCTRAAQLIDQGAQAAQSAVRHMAATWSASAESADAPDWVRQKLSAKPEQLAQAQ